MKIFISYRRADSQLAAAELHRELELLSGPDSEIFLDLASINPGDPFPERIAAKVADCDVLLALIGPKWLDVAGADGVRRLESANDYVRLEIASALRRQARVVPVYLESTQLDEASNLPDDLKSVATLNSVSMRQPTFGLDVEKLAARLGLPGHHDKAVPDRAPEHGSLHGQYVYVSYPEQIELPRLRAVVRRLLSEQIPVWIHNPVALGFRPQELRGMMSERSGQTWKEGALAALNSAKCILALVDRTTAQSKRQGMELATAVKRGVLSCAALDADRADLPASLIKRNPWIVLTDDIVDTSASKVIQGMVSDVRVLLGRTDTPKAGWPFGPFRRR